MIRLRKYLHGKSTESNDKALFELAETAAVANFIPSVITAMNACTKCGLAV